MVITIHHQQMVLSKRAENGDEFALGRQFRVLDASFNEESQSKDCGNGWIDLARKPPSSITKGFLLSILIRKGSGRYRSLGYKGRGQGGCGDQISLQVPASGQNKRLISFSISFIILWTSYTNLLAHDSCSKKKKTASTYNSCYVILFKFARKHPEYLITSSYRWLVVGKIC